MCDGGIDPRVEATLGCRTQPPWGIGSAGSAGRDALPRVLGMPDGMRIAGA